MSLQWSQWIDENHLFICGGEEPGNDTCCVVAKYVDGEWEDISEVVLPENNRPVAMELIAMWMELPEPDPVLLKELNERQIRASDAALS
jgi:hypothetical protein